MALLVTSTKALQTMALEDIVKEICQRVNDPYEDNYQDRARELFIASAFQQINDAKWTRFDYHGIIQSQEYSTGLDDARSYGILGRFPNISGTPLPHTFAKYIVNIIDVVSADLSENNEATRKFVPIDISEANRIATDEDLEPIVGEVYWYMVGQKIYFHPNPTEDMKNLKFIIEFLANPYTFQEDEDMLLYYSVAYIYEAIDVATGKLLAEIGLA